MLVLSLFSWWYGAGWLQLMHRVFARIAGVLDFFSVGLLFRTLFAPYRQISVGSVQGSLEVQMRAWFDLQISRVIGAMVRLSVIIFGIIATLLMCVCALGLLLLWPLVPVLPVAAAFIALGGAR